MPQIYTNYGWSTLYCSSAATFWTSISFAGEQLIDQIGLPVNDFLPVRIENPSFLTTFVRKFGFSALIGALKESPPRIRRMRKATAVSLAPWN